MTTVTIYDKPTGRILRAITMAEEMIASNVKEEEGTYEGWVDGARFYIGADGMPVAIPDLPSPGLKFDWEAKTWVDPRALPEAKTAKKLAVERERARRTNATIEYDGCVLDADATAQNNIKSKLLALASNMGLGKSVSAELLVWRDFDNVTHSFESMEALQSWLQGLVVEIDSRGTQFYMWAWAKKALIDAAQSLAEVDAIDIET
jgi:hypothetical protein